MYEINSGLIAAALLLLMLAAMWSGWAFGRKLQREANREEKTQTTGVQASLLGLLALVLGFSFSLSLARFDARSVAVLNEANAIGTAWLRLDLLPIPQRDKARALMLSYTDRRIEAGDVSTVENGLRGDLIAAAQAEYAALWALATENARETPTPVSMGVISALNDMSDALAARDAAVQRHVPELVFWTLFGTFIIQSALVGFSSGLSGVRPGVPVHVLLAVIILVVFTIIDLDRPRRGFIAIDQSPLTAVRSGMSAR